jgi:hypothetical protein
MAPPSVRFSAPYPKSRPDAREMNNPPILDLPDREAVARKIREFAARLDPGLRVDELELAHLADIVTNHTLLLNDLYSARRLDQIMGQDPAASLQAFSDLSRLEEDLPSETIRKMRRIPDNARLVGDKCLYDVGLIGRRQHQGLNLEALGVRCYGIASEILEWLAMDRRLRDYFKQNRLGPMPIEEEVIFLRQCAERFAFYAEVLRNLHILDPVGRSEATVGPAAPEVTPSGLRPGMSPRIRPDLDDDTGENAAAGGATVDAVADVALPGLAGEAAPSAKPAFQSPHPSEAKVPGAEKLPRRDLLSLYERLVLFANLDVDALRRELSRVVVDQEEAVTALCDELSLYATGTQSLNRPASFFLVGPTGVGKNHLVESFARAMESIWGIEVPLLLLEGPQFTYPSDINELKGAARGFIRSDEEGILTEFYGKASLAPLSIILIDEIEKAHPQLRKFLLGLMDRGTTMDNRGDTLHFANTLFFYTSNVGYSRLQSSTSPIGFGDAAAQGEFRHREVVQDLKKVMSPEFVNRVSVIRFRPLSLESVERIFDLELEKVACRYREVQGVTLHLTARARSELIRQGYNPEYGARPLARVINRVCNVEVSKRLKKDERRNERETEGLLAYLREAREGNRALDPAAIGRVMGEARAHVGYASLQIDFKDGVFTYTPAAAPS